MDVGSKYVPSEATSLTKPRPKACCTATFKSLRLESFARDTISLRPLGHKTVTEIRPRLCKASDFVVWLCQLVQQFDASTRRKIITFRRNHHVYKTRHQNMQMKSGTGTKTQKPFQQLRTRLQLDSSASLCVSLVHRMPSKVSGYSQRATLEWWFLERTHHLEPKGSKLSHT